MRFSVVFPLIVLLIPSIAHAEDCQEHNYRNCEIQKIKPEQLDIKKALAADRAKDLTARQISFHLDSIHNLMRFDRKMIGKILADKGIRIKTLNTNRLSFKYGFLRSGWTEHSEGGSVHFDEQFHGKGIFNVENDNIAFTPRRLVPKQKVVEHPELGKVVTLERVPVPVGPDDTYRINFVGGTLGEVDGLGSIDGPLSFVGGFPYVAKGGRLIVDDIEIADTNGPVLLCRDTCSPVVRGTGNFAWFKEDGIEAQGKFSLQFTDVGYFDVLGQREGYAYRKENDYLKIFVGNSEIAGKIKLRTAHNLISEISSQGFVRVISGGNRYTVVDGKIRDHSVSGDGRRGSVPVTILAASGGRTVATVVGEDKKTRRMSMNDYAVMTRLRENISFKLRGFFAKSVLEVFERSSRSWKQNHDFDLGLIRMRDQFGKIYPVTVIEGTISGDSRGAEAPTGWPTDIYWFIKWMKPSSEPDTFDTSVGTIFSGQSATHEIFHAISQLDSRRAGRMDSGPLYQAFSRALSGRKSAAFKAPSSYGSDDEEWLAGTGAALVHDPNWVRQVPGRQSLARPLLDHLQKYKSGKLPIPIIDRSSGYLFAQDDFRKYEGEVHQFPSLEITQSDGNSESENPGSSDEVFEGFEN